MEQLRIPRLEDYEPHIGAEAVERILRKGEALRDFHVVHVNSTYYGGGVAELLGSLSLLMNQMGLRAGWRIIQGSPDFFSITKKMHNALQGGAINLSEIKKAIYEHVVHENALRNHLDQDMVIIHDPQPLPLITHYKKRCPWVWTCHVDLSAPNPELWSYLTPFVEQYDAVILSLKEYERKLKTPQVFFKPAIDPFSLKNREMEESEIEERLAHYGIPVDLPLVVQVSRFDTWKDPGGVIEAFKIARREVDATLVLLGNVATDDPEGEEIYRDLVALREERILILSKEDSGLVNALQRKAAVVLQKSLREGFGLTVAEAMWKGTPVIGGNVGGIRHQVIDGVNGFLVSSVAETAERIVTLLRDEKLRKKMGVRGREVVREHFLMTRYLEQYLDLFTAFETFYRLDYGLVAGTGDAGTE
jgi:trehalose synthase